MKRRPHTLRALAVVALAAMGLAAHASISAGEETAEEAYGTVEAIDPLVGFDWAPAIEDPLVADAAAGGATVTEEPCTFGNRPGVPNPIFVRPIRTTGHLVVAPSGNVTFICHAAAEARSFERPLPTSAIVVEPVPCFLPGGRRTTNAQLVVTPSLHVHLVCHFQPPS
jgi:hypothetical protein